MHVLIISDGKAGHQNQSIGVAEALGASYSIFSTQEGYVQLKKLFSNHEYGLVIGAGKRTQSYLKWVKKNIKGSFTVLLMRPYGFLGLPLSPQKWHKHFDVVAMLEHDAIGLVLPENTITTVGAPNRVLPKNLNEAKLRFSKQLDSVADKKIAVLIGGKSKRFDFNCSHAEELLHGVLRLAEKESAGLLITTSRRTGEEQTAHIKNILTQSSVPYYLWDGEGDNPIMGYFACADAFVVTAESTSMVSEACSTGQPVYVYGLDKNMQMMGMGKFNKFYHKLYEQGAIQSLMTAESFTSPHPLNDTSVVAHFIREKLKD